MRELISVVIPIYNVENYLRECIDSIINQTYKNIELLLIDDGSTDISGDICDEYALVDKRIKVYHKENGGLSDARNYGVNMSKGEYIYFIDSDDFLIRNDVIELLYKNLIKYNVDLASATYNVYFEGNIFSDFKSKYNINIFNAEEVILNIYNYKKYKATFIFAHNKLYKKYLFDDINYPYGKLYEDEFTNYKLYLKAKRILYIDLETYAYRQREGSIMHSEYSLRNLDIFEAIEEKIKILKLFNIDTLDTERHYMELLSYNMYMLNKNRYYKYYDILNDKLLILYPRIKNKYSFKKNIKLFIMRYFNYIYFKYIKRK